MFDGLNGYEQYEDAIYQRGIDKRAEAVERTRLWRILNPAKFRKTRRAWVKRWRLKNPSKVKAQRQRQYNRKRQKSPEKLRAQWRQNQQRRRARLKEESK
jgi:hypothetical protein